MKTPNSLIERARKILTDNPGMGRYRLAKELGVGEMTARTVKERLQDTAGGRVPPADPTDARVLELERRLQQASDEQAKLLAKLRVTHREEGVFQACAAEIRACVPSWPPVAKPLAANKTAKVVEDLVMHVSDEHADQVVKPHMTQGCENYNFRVAMARAEQYVDKVIDFTLGTLVNYRFETLWMLFYGDHVNGEIHDATNHSEYRNAIRNALAVGHMHGQMIRDLAARFPAVKVVYVPGNHGRRTPKKQFPEPWNNWDHLVAETAAILAKGPHIDFLVPEAWTVNLSIRGWGFNVSHGDSIRAWNTIPWYGIERQTRRLSSVHASMGKKIDYFVRGHFHAPATLPHPGGEVLMNGSWKATDVYGLEQIGEYREPTQLLHGVHDKHGVSWRLPVRLKFKGDSLGPSRYRADILAVA